MFCIALLENKLDQTAGSGLVVDWEEFFLFCVEGPFFGITVSPVLSSGLEGSSSWLSQCDFG